jgi:hypothetical protein
MEKELILATRWNIKGRGKIKSIQLFDEKNKKNR